MQASRKWYLSVVVLAFLSCQACLSQCSQTQFSIPSSFTILPWSGGTGSLWVEAPIGCPWSISIGPPTTGIPQFNPIAVNPTSGTGPGEVTFQYSSNRNGGGASLIVSGGSSPAPSVQIGVSAKLVCCPIRDDQTFQTHSLLQWSAVGSVLQHVTGSAFSCQGPQWAGTAPAAQNWLQYGPYTTTVPVGNNIAVWTLQEPFPNGNTNTIAILDANDATIQTRIASRQISAASFPQTGALGGACNVSAFNSFILPFTVDSSEAGHAFEFRIFWDGNADLGEQAVGFFPLQFNSQSSPNHVIGRPDQDGWSASVGVDSPNWLQYGPYTTSVPVGKNLAMWEMTVDNNSGNEDGVVTLDVNDATTQTQLASMQVTRPAFENVNSYNTFVLPFFLDSSRTGHAIEFRTFWLGTAYVRIQATGFTPDNPITPQ